MIKKTTAVYEPTYSVAFYGQSHGSALKSFSSSRDRSVVTVGVERTSRSSLYKL